MADPRLEALVIAARTARDRGDDAPLEWFCRDCPELLVALRERLELTSTRSIPASDSNDTDTAEPDAVPVAAPVMERLGGYRIVGVLGQGGMGAVYHAHDDTLNRALAVKTMRAEIAARPGAAARFLREARSAAEISHESVIPIFSFGEESGTPYLVMPLLEGEPLDSRLRREAILPIREVLRIGREIAEGLAAAHEKGLIHRDIKPANIWLEGTRQKVKILDFGLARPQSADAEITGEGAILGTPAYMAPEQARGLKLDHRADLFSLGVVLYRMATGRLPFKGATSAAVMMAIGIDTQPPANSVNPGVPMDLSRAIDRMLAKNPQDRPNSAAEVSGLLAAIDAGLWVVGSPPPPPATDWATVMDEPRPTPLPTETATNPGTPIAERGRTVWYLVAGVAGLLGVLLAAVLMWSALREKPTPQPDSNDPAEPKPKPGTNTPPAPKSRDDWPAAEPVAPWVPGPSPLDNLDPKQIPPAERFSWQPPELVAVIGTHTGKHWSGADLFAIDPTGRRVATHSSSSHGDKWVRIWDPKTGKQTAVIAKNDFYPSGAAFTADGNKIVVAWMGSADRLGENPAILYDLTGPLPQVVPWTDNLVIGRNKPWRLHAVADDARMMWGSFLVNNQTYLVTWDTTTGKFGERQAGLIMPAVTPNGRVVVTADASTISVLDSTLPNFGPRCTIPIQDGCAGVAVSADGNVVAAAFPKREKIVIYDTSAATGEVIDEFPTKDDRPIVSPNGRRVGSWSGKLLYELDGGKLRQMKPIPGVHSSTRCAFTADSSGLVQDSISFASQVRFWSLAGAAPQEIAPTDRQLSFDSLTEPSGNPSRTGWSLTPNGMLACKRGDEQSELWDLTGNAPRRSAENPVDGYPSAVDSPLNQLVLYRRAESRLLPVAPNAVGKTIPLGATFLQAATTHDGRYSFGLESNASRVLRWDRTRPEQPAQPIAGLDALRRMIAFAVRYDGRVLALMFASEPRIELHDVTASTARFLGQVEFGDFPKAFAFSPDGRSLAVSLNLKLRIVHVATGVGSEPTDLPVPIRAHSVRYHPDGKSILIVSSSGLIAIWDVATRKKVKDWRLPGNVSFANYSPDGRHLYTINGNGTIYILRLAAAPGKPAG